MKGIPISWLLLGSALLAIVAVITTLSYIADLRERVDRIEQHLGLGPRGSAH